MLAYPPNKSTKVIVNHKPNNRTFIVGYDGKDYEASYTFSSSYLVVDVFWSDLFHETSTTHMRSGAPLPLARLKAWEILRGAKERGELN